MKDGFLKAAAAAPKIRVADPAWNALEICKALDSCYAQRAKLIVLPELCLTGYTCQDLFLQERLLEESLEGLQAVLEHTKGHDALTFVGLPLEKDGKLYNVAAAVQDGRILGLVPKQNIPNYGEFYEVRHFAAGSREVSEVDVLGQTVPFGGNLLFSCRNLKGLVVGCELCEDVWVMDPPSTALAKAGATVIVNLSASNETVGKDTYRKSLIAATSARLLCSYVYASAGDGESTQDLVFSGHHMIAENGSVLAEAARFENETIFSELDVHKICHERRRMSTFVPENTEHCVRIGFTLEKEETRLTRTFVQTPFVPSDEALKKERCEQILSIQAHGLKKRYEHTGAQTAVIGVSGGLDSTLALLVTARAFDLLGKSRSDIIAVTMPCFGTTNRTYENACRLAQTLGAKLVEVNIREAVQVHFRDIGQDMEKHDVTYENGQARERTQVLMDLANQSNGLVIGTGDMSELALGWATYNGDHMSMYGVNAGVPKTLIRYLVDYEAKRTNNDILKKTLQDILDTPVSPELLPPKDGKISQKTEHIVGPYELHDFFLYHLMRFGSKPSKILRLAEVAFEDIYDREVILEWLKVFYRRFFAQQFKRSCLPDGPKVGSVALSPRGDWRMPSDASYQIWAKELETL